MKKEEPLVFKEDGRTYTYHFYITEYDGNNLVKWSDCVWEPKDLKAKYE